MILAIDPGTTQSAFCWYENGHIEEFGIWPNNQIIEKFEFIKAHDTHGGLRHKYVIEMVASYGMAVGKEVFETVRWIGRFQQAAPEPERVEFIYRKEVKIHLCGSMKAKDVNIRQALIDKIGPQGTKKDPGPTYGISKDVWSALAVAVTYAETKQRESA